MKTPDMAKENNFVLREAAKAACDGYYTHLQNGGKGDPAEERWIEALTAGADAIAQVAVLESRLAQAERERDAALKDIANTCWSCRNAKPSQLSKFLYSCPHLKGKAGVRTQCENWQWRGVCEENTKEGPHAD